MVNAPSRLAWKRIETRGTPPAPRSFATAVKFQDMVVVYGGRNAIQTFGDTFALVLPQDGDTASSATWIPVRVSNGTAVRARAYHTAVLNGASMIVYGGRNIEDDYFGDLVMLDLNNVRAYVDSVMKNESTATQKRLLDQVRWATVATPLNALVSRGYHSAVMVPPELNDGDSLMVVVAGHDRHRWCDVVSTYSPSTNEWLHFTDFRPLALGAPRAANSCTCVAATIAQPPATPTDPSAAARRNARCHRPQCLEQGWCCHPSAHQSPVVSNTSLLISRPSSAASAVRLLACKSAPVSRTYEPIPPRDAAAVAFRRRRNGGLSVVIHGGELRRVFHASLLEYDVPRTSPSLPPDNCCVVEHTGYREAARGPLGLTHQTSVEFHSKPPCGNAETHAIAPTPRAYHHGFMHGDDYFFIWGGYTDLPPVFTDDAYMFDFHTQRWSLVEQTGEVPTARASMATCALDSSCVLFFGGDDGSEYANEVFIAEPHVDVTLRSFATRWITSFIDVAGSR